MYGKVTKERRDVHHSHLAYLSTKQQAIRALEPDQSPELHHSSGIHRKW